MTRVRVNLFVSLDGFTSATDNSPDNPMGEDWGRLAAGHIATRTFRERVFGDTSGAGTTGVDDRYTAAFFEGVGAEIMGAGMFGLHAFPGDPEWKGWWGDRPPVRHAGLRPHQHTATPRLVETGPSGWIPVPRGPATVDPDGGRNDIPLP